MNHTFRIVTGSLAGAALLTALAAMPAWAQEKVSGGGGAGGAGGGGGKTASAPAPSAPSGGGSGGPVGGSVGGSNAGSKPGPSGGGGFVKGGGDERRGGATGGSGYAVPRSPRAADDGNRGSGATSGGGERRGRSGGEVTGRTANTPGSTPTGDGVPIYSRPRDGGDPVGTAVPRGTTPRPSGPSIFVPGGYYYPGYYGGYGGYYGGYYDPWWGGYYGAGYYDPWYGGYPVDLQSTYSSTDEGSLRLKIKPREAEVYVDGYYTGVVDDFDGIFQRLHLDSGPHRIEVRAPGYETLEFEVRITPDHTTTYQGELKKIQ